MVNLALSAPLNVQILIGADVQNTLEFKKKQYFKVFRTLTPISTVWYWRVSLRTLVYVCVCY